MDHSVIETLLNNKFVLHKVCDGKYHVTSFNIKPNDDNPVVLEYDSNTGMYTMYRSRVPFGINYTYYRKGFNIIEFIEHFRILSLIDVPYEMALHSRSRLNIDLDFVISHTNYMPMMAYAPYSDLNNKVKNLKVGFMNYIRELMKNPNYLRDKSVPNEFKAFIAQTDDWMFKMQDVVIPLYFRPLNQRKKLLKLYMKLQGQGNLWTS